MDRSPRTIAYSLRPATRDDVDFIYRLRVDGLKKYVAQIWGWDETYQRDRFWTSFDVSRYRVIVVEKRDVGAIAVDHRDSELFLADIEIAREWRGQGLGTSILSDFLSDARDRGLLASLRVLKVNPARRLYLRLGFQIVGETDTHFLMSTSREDPDSP